MTGLFKDMLAYLHDDVVSILGNAGIDINTTGLSDLFSAQSAYANPFVGLETQYLQLKYYKKEFNLLVRIIQFSVEFLSFNILGATSNCSRY